MTTPRLRRASARPLSPLALALAAAVLVAGASLARPAEAHAQDGDHGAAIVAAALGYVGSWQGECFPWVVRVVKEATGLQMGFGYRDAYLDGGAVEIPLHEAHAGDVIQLADDSRLAPDDSYPGLHTVIVVQSYGDGTFKAVDSNWQWDGIVRIRDNYAPAAQAAQYPHITARAYRFPVGAVSTAPSWSPSPASSSDPPAPREDPLEPGTSAIVRGDGQCLRLRGEPGLNGSLKVCMPDGSIVTVLDGSVEVDGYRWQLIDTGAQTGWAADQFLDPAGSAPPSSNQKPPGNSGTTPPDTGAASPSSGTRTISGQLPSQGGLALIVWGGGSTEDIRVAAFDQGCGVLSVWASKPGGGLIGYIANAPGFVNAAWDAQFPDGTLAGEMALLLTCAAGEVT